MKASLTNESPRQLEGIGELGSTTSSFMYFQEAAMTESSGLEEETTKRRRDEMMWQAGRMAHAVLGLGAPDERDPLGLNRKAALKALAYQFLNLAKRKHLPVVVRLKELQPGDSHAFYAILAQCLDTQLDQVFGALDERECSEALRRLAQEIGNRYQESSGPFGIR